MVWVTLQISEEEAAFAEDQWWRYAYADRDDYLNGLLALILLREMSEDDERTSTDPNSEDDSDGVVEIPF